MTQVIKMMAEEFLGKSVMHKVGVLAMDEMSIDQAYGMDVEEEQVFGGEKNALVISVRGLFSSWKQIIYYDFKGHLDKKFIMEVLIQLHNAGITVVAVVTDMGSHNQGLWKELGICKVRNGKINKTSFSHPATKTNIWVFPDFPHLLKLLRNHLLDTFLTVRVGDDMFKLDKALIQKLLSAQNREFCAAYKLKNKHIFLRGRERQNVRTAFQLFSRTTSKALKFAFPELNREADFISLINDFSDLCNTRIKIADKHNPFKSPFGLEIEKQKELLGNVSNVLKRMTVGNRNEGKWAPFQKGFIVYIESLLGLYGDMIEDPINATFIMTAHLNQDFLENTFSSIRGQSGFKLNPTAIEIKNRIKKVLFSRSFYKCQNSSVSIDDEQNSQMSSSWTMTRMLNVLTKDSPNSSDVVEESAVKAKFVQIGLSGINSQISVNSRSSNSCVEEKCELAGMEYVAGYLASKLLEDHPEFGHQDHNYYGKDHSWVVALSRKGIIQPSQVWLATFEKFNDFFDAFHSNSINKRKRILKDLEEVLIKTYPSIPVPAIKFYVKTRTNIRIRHLNKMAENEKYKKQEYWYKSKRSSKCTKTVDDFNQAGDVQLDDSPLEDGMDNENDEMDNGNDEMDNENDEMECEQETVDDYVETHDGFVDLDQLCFVLYGENQEPI
jgi:Transposase protein